MKKLRIAFLGLLALLLVSICTACSENDTMWNAAETTKGETTIQYRLLSQEQDRIVNMFLSDRAEEYALFDYHFDDDMEGVNFRLRVYQREEMVSDSLILGIHMDKPASRDGQIALIMETEGVQVKVMDSSGKMYDGNEAFSKGTGSQIVDGGSHSIVKGGTSDEHNCVQLFLKGVYYGSDPGISILQKRELKETLNNYDCCLEVYAQVY